MPGPSIPLSVIGPALAALGLAAPAGLAEPVEVSGRNIQYITTFERTEISDRHFMAAMEASGVTIDPAGEITTNKAWGQVDRIDGAGRDRGYMVRIWPDGAMTVERFESEARLDAEGASVFEGSFDYVFGTGRFEGLTGAGSFQGRAFDNGMLVVDWTASMEVLPE